MYPQKEREETSMADESHSATEYIKSAEAGDSKAQYNLAVCYANGEGVEQDFEKAMFWWQKAAEQGDVDAQSAIGRLYLKGLGVEVDMDKAFEWTERAAKGGCADAMANLGILYYVMGWGVETNLDKSGEWLIKAAENGVTEAMSLLSTYYEMGFVVEKDVQKAFEWAMKAAELGDAGAQKQVGDFYLNVNVQVVEKNPEEAFKWYLKSAEQECAKGEFAAANCYLDGVGVEKDVSKGIQFLMNASYHGDSDAMYRLGNICLISDKTDDAITLFKKSAELGNQDAQLKLFAFYYKDNTAEAIQWLEKGLENREDEASAAQAAALGLWYSASEHLDREKSFKWLSVGAEKGSAEAMCLLGEMLEYAKTNPKGIDDKEAAFNWFKKAAETGLAHAQKKLADYYSNGIVVKEDVNTAIELYKAAAKQGDYDAMNYLKYYYSLLGKCRYCGGEFTGLIFKKCSVCGRKKDY